LHRDISLQYETTGYIIYFKFISTVNLYMFQAGLLLRRRWEDNIKIDFQEVGCGAVNWIELAQDRDRWRSLVNAVMNLRVP